MSLAGLSVRKPRFGPAAVFAAAALLAVLPLVIEGCSCGHDFDFHLLSWMEAASQWQHGIVKPVWAFTAAYNAGEPRLLFYPPLSWTTGAFLGMVMPWTLVPAVFTWIVLLLSGLTMHRLLQRWASPAVATLGGCLYMVNPYMLFCAYERTAYGELMAAAWMPLLLAAMLRSRVSAWRVALPVALLWLTNAPAAVVGLYSVAILGLLRLFSERKFGLNAALRVAGTVTAGVLLALLADAFYLIPLAMERRYVQLAMAVIPITTPDHNFLFMRDPDIYHTHVLVQASWIAVGTLSVAILCGAILRMRRKSGEAVHAYASVLKLTVERSRETSVPVAILTAFSVVVLCLLLPFSAPVWRVAPELIFLQFPWRFLAIESAAMIVLLCFVLQWAFRGARPSILAAGGVLLAAIAGWFAGGTYFREACDDNQTVQAQRDQFVQRSGVEPTDEYTPEIADNDLLKPHLPPAWLAEGAARDPGQSPAVNMNDRHPEDVQFITPASDNTILVVRMRKFPGWHVLRDGVEIDPEIRDDGLMVVPVAAGHRHTVEVRYRTTRDQWAGLAVSGMTWLTVFAAAWRRRFGMMNHP